MGKWLRITDARMYSRGRAIRLVRGVATLLFVAFLGMLWFVPVHGPVQFGRERLSLNPGISSSIPFVDWLILGFLLVCVAAVAWFERQRETRLEPLVLLGAWFGIVVGVIQFHAVRSVPFNYYTYDLPQAPFELARFLIPVSLFLSALGLVSCLVRRNRRGTVIGFCALAIVSTMNWAMEHFVLAPNWAQPEGRVEPLELAVAPTSTPWFWRTDRESHFVSLRVEDGRVVIGAQGDLLTAHEYPECLRDYAEDMRLRTLEWDGQQVEFRTGVLLLRTTPDVPVSAILEVIENAREAGIERFAFDVLHAPPHIEGCLWVVSNSPYNQLDPGETYGFTVRSPDLEAGESQVRIHDGEHKGTELTDFMKRDAWPDAGLGRWQWPRVILYLESGLLWGELAPVLDDLITATYLIFLEPLEEPAPR